MSKAVGESASEAPVAEAGATSEATGTDGAPATGEGSAAPSSDAAASSTSSTCEFTTVKEIIGKKLGIINGSVADQILMDMYDGIDQDDILYFNSYAEIIQALKTHKIDVMVCDLPVGQLAVSRNTGICVMPEKLVKDQYGMVLEKNSPYTAMINERLAAYREDGTIEALYKKWTGADESVKTLPEQNWDTPNGTLTVAVGADAEPMSYQRGNEPAGMSVDLMYHAARDLGYGLECRPLALGSLIAEVQSGKADIATSCFSITDERKQMVDMTDPFYQGGMVAVVRDTAAGAGEELGFFEAVAASFERTFITEGRWQLILSGLGVTMLISIVSGVAGLALGFLFVLLRRKREGGLADKLIHALESLLGGLPVVVVLMVFYYVVFGELTIPGVVVAILVFTLLFGASSGSIMWNAIRAIDVGQVEAGRALGFGDRDTFAMVVLPRAARQFVPLLIAQFVSLVKDTSVVGYIAVQDLTRVGDLIRARTMEAFFPLIAIAIIYFVLCRVMARLLGRWAKRLEPKDEPRTIKGVEL
ncbi:MAG: transporter substrate-binding domain-containing protein [Atopobiaceae bacterium]|nr:transporter substrate-binding domain-containing protein [Atopobiaceae bacterium]